MLWSQRSECLEKLESTGNDMGKLITLLQQRTCHRLYCCSSRFCKPKYHPPPGSWGLNGVCTITLVTGIEIDRQTGTQTDSDSTAQRNNTILGKIHIMIFENFAVNIKTAVCHISFWCCHEQCQQITCFLFSIIHMESKIFPWNRCWMTFSVQFLLTFLLFL